MKLFPAIDVMDGQVVRLSQGQAERKTVYSADPVAQARAFARAGARYLHVVDLDAAFRKGDNRRVIARVIAESGGLDVQVGGGVRDLYDVGALRDMGAWRVVIGSAAVEDPELVGQAVARFGAHRVAVGLDARDGTVRIKGWTEGAGRATVDVARDMARRGVTTLVYTDIARDGMLGAPDVEGAVELARATGCRVVVSGGVASEEHVGAIAGHGERERIDGVIVGKALYEGKLDVTRAVRLIEEG
jgi:phosphoribosylformimino-5-aminoimidazole carboxamide ribotide isomerase